VEEISSAKSFDGKLSVASQRATTCVAQSLHATYTLLASKCSWVAAQQLFQILNSDAPTCLRNPEPAFTRRLHFSSTANAAGGVAVAVREPLKVSLASPQFRNATIDSAPRDPRRRRNRRHSATAQFQRLVRRKQSTSPFVQKTSDPAVPDPKRCHINHKHKI
jgi:hypothetical protein